MLFHCARKFWFALQKGVDVLRKGKAWYRHWKACFTIILSV